MILSFQEAFSRFDNNGDGSISTKVEKVIFEYDMDDKSLNSEHINDGNDDKDDDDDNDDDNNNNDKNDDDDKDDKDDDEDDGDKDGPAGAGERDEVPGPESAGGRVTGCHE